jgi:hypothetical protein
MWRRLESIEQLAYGPRNMQIRAFVSSPDVVGFSNGTFFKHCYQRSSVVFNVQPIADVKPVSIDRKVFISQPSNNQVGDQLFWKMIWAVII